MEAGKTVILLNLEKLYESLYDVLNQVCFCKCFRYFYLSKLSLLLGQ